MNPRMLTDKIDVLDHGFVRLVDFMGGDLAVVRAARVSYNAGWRAGQDEGSDERLIRYLWKHAHTSPFEAVEFQFEVKAPIFVVRQWHRHRTWSYNELSGRYKELPEEFYLPDPNVVGIQSGNNKQGRDLTPIIDPHYNEAFLARRREQIDSMRTYCTQQFALYRELLQDGWPRELARSVLPLSTYTHMFAKVDLHNLFRFLTLRLSTHAQYEVRVYAEAILHLIEEVVPISVKAWRDGEAAAARL